MARMINPTMIALDPSFDPGQPFIVPFLTTFVGVRTKMNMRLMEERIKRADPSRLYEMAKASRANAAALRKQAGQVDEAYLEQRGQLVSRIASGMASIASAEAGAKGRVAAAKIESIAALQIQQDKTRLEIAEMYGVEPGLPAEIGLVLDLSPQDPIDPRMAAEAAASVNAAWGLNLSPRAAHVLKRATDAGGVDAAGFKAGMPQHVGTMGAVKTELWRAHRDALAQGWDEEAAIYKEAAEAVESETGGMAEFLAGAATEDELNDRIEKLNQIGVGGATKGMLEWVEANAGDLMEGQSESADLLRRQALDAEIRAAKLQSRGDELAALDPRDVMAPEGGGNLFTSALNTRAARIQPGLDRAEYSLDPSRDRDSLDAMARQPFRPQAAVREIGEMGQTRRPTSPAPDVAGYLYQMMVSGDEQDVGDAIDIIKSLPPDIQVLFNVPAAKMAAESGDYQGFKDTIREGLRDMRSQGGYSLDARLAGQLDDLAGIQQPQDYIVALNEVMAEIENSHPLMLGDSQIEFQRAVEVYTRRPSTDAYYELRRELGRISERATNRVGVWEDERVRDVSAKREAARVELEEAGPAVLPLEAEFAMQDASTWDLPADINFEPPAARQPSSAELDAAFRSALSSLGFVPQGLDEKVPPPAVGVDPQRHYTNWLLDNVPGAAESALFSDETVPGTAATLAPTGSVRRKQLGIENAQFMQGHQPEVPFGPGYEARNAAWHSAQADLNLIQRPLDENVPLPPAGVDPQKHYTNWLLDNEPGAVESANPLPDTNRVHDVGF